MKFDELNYHPGYSLAIRTLGNFEVWRGKTLTSPRDWQREKARQLFQFFVSNNGKWFSREQLADRLWPDLDHESSTQNLKVALNALTRALEPLREPGQTPFFITRRDTLYGVNPSASIAIDTEDFLVAGWFKPASRIYRPRMRSTRAITCVRIVWNRGRP